MNLIINPGRYPRNDELDAWLESLTDRDLIILCLQQRILVEPIFLHRFWTTANECLAECKDRGVLFEPEAERYIQRSIDDKKPGATTGNHHQARIGNSPTTDQ